VPVEPESPACDDPLNVEINSDVRKCGCHRSSDPQHACCKSSQL